MLCATLLAAVVPAAAAPGVLTIDSPEYGRSLALLDLPAHPLGIVVLLPGGDGRIGIAEDDTTRSGDNFLVRTRDTWITKGYGTLLIDAPQQGPGLPGKRHRSDYATVVAGGVRRVGALGLPVSLVGTSQGSVAATSAVALLSKSMSGLVLLSAVAARGDSGETVFDVPSMRPRCACSSSTIRATGVRARRRRPRTGLQRR